MFRDPDDWWNGPITAENLAALKHACATMLPVLAKAASRVLDEAVLAAMKEKPDAD